MNFSISKELRPLVDALQNSQDELGRREDFANRIRELRDEARMDDSGALALLGLAYERAMVDVLQAQCGVSYARGIYEGTATRLGLRDVYQDREEKE